MFSVKLLQGVSVQTGIDRQGKEKSERPSPLCEALAAARLRAAPSAPGGGSSKGTGS